ncbi:MAG: HAD family hydrolase [Planctomycetaceae bacterium]
MPRFVVLQHDWPQLHWDLMLENGASLRTWRLAEVPCSGHPIALVRLPPHRSIYLDYEGPVSGNRGTVKRVLGGTYQPVPAPPGEAWFEFDLGGERWLGQITGPAADQEEGLVPEPPGHLVWRRAAGPSDCSPSNAEINTVQSGPDAESPQASTSPSIHPPGHHSMLPALPADRRSLPGTRIEIVRDGIPRGRVRVAVFDFDGTLSLIREGWPELMIPLMVEHLAQAPRAEPRDQLGQRVEEFVMRLNGKPTIHQMIQLAEEIRARGGEPLAPMAYKQEFQERLLQRVHSRTRGLREGTVEAESLTVPGSLELLRALAGQGLELSLASGTDLVYVKQELEALGLQEFFGDRVYGAIDDDQSYSKQMIIDRLVAERQLGPGELLGFGDGFVEIQEVSRVGGIAVGVASDETHRVGVNDWKRNRLIEAGAELIVPDYRDLSPLLGHLALGGAVIS